MTANDDELVPAAWVEDLPFHDEAPDISDIAGRRIREIVERAAMDRHRGNDDIFRFCCSIIGANESLCYAHTTHTHTTDELWSKLLNLPVGAEPSSLVSDKELNLLMRLAYWRPIEELDPSLVSLYSMYLPWSALAKQLSDPHR